MHISPSVAFSYEKSCLILLHIHLFQSPRSISFWTFCFKASSKVQMHTCYSRSAKYLPSILTHVRKLRQKQFYFNKMFQNIEVLQTKQTQCKSNISSHCLVMSIPFVACFLTPREQIYFDKISYFHMV